MKYNPSDKLITASLDLIRAIEPSLAARMLADDWQVSTDFREAFSGVFETAPHDVPALYRQATGDGNFGLTLPVKPNPLPTSETFINAREIKRWAQANDVRVLDFAADVLVHEFTHTSQDGGSQGSAPNIDLEIPAYQAGSAFARKLGKRGAPIVALSESNLAQIQEMKADPFAALLAQLGLR